MKSLTASERDYLRLWLFSWAGLAAALNALHLYLFLFEMYWPAILATPVLAYVTVREIKFIMLSLDVEQQREAQNLRARADLARHAGRGFIPHVIGDAA